jgi:hypothetical protein
MVVQEIQMVIPGNGRPVRSSEVEGLGRVLLVQGMVLPPPHPMAL